MKINGIDFLIGADPEFFVSKGGKAVSAYGLVPGTKEAPHAVKKGAVQVDGMALEFNINPAETFAAFEDHMVTVMDQILRMVPGYEVFADPPNPRIGQLLHPVAEFGKDYIESQPDVAKELGCNPDFNAYTQKANPRPNADTPFRTASGHVHIGWTKDVDPNDPTHLEACFALTKHLDVWLGVPSLIWDKDNRRRQLYGRAGAFRPKSYGMEYRVLSNRWISSPLLRKLVYWNSVEAIRACFEEPDAWEGKKFQNCSVENIVNQEGGTWKEGAEDLLNFRNIRTPAWYREHEAK